MLQNLVSIFNGMRNVKICHISKNVAEWQRLIEKNQSLCTTVMALVCRVYQRQQSIKDDGKSA